MWWGVEAPVSSGLQPASHLDISGAATRRLARLGLDSVLQCITGGETRYQLARLGHMVARGRGHLASRLARLARAARIETSSLPITDEKDVAPPPPFAPMTRTWPRSPHRRTHPPPIIAQHCEKRMLRAATTLRLHALPAALARTRSCRERANISINLLITVAMRPCELLLAPDQACLIKQLDHTEVEYVRHHAFKQLRSQIWQR